MIWRVSKQTNICFRLLPTHVWETLGSDGNVCNMKLIRDWCDTGRCPVKPCTITSIPKHTFLVSHPTEDSTHVHKLLHCCAIVLPEVLASPKTSQYLISPRLNTGSTLASAHCANTRKKGSLVQPVQLPICFCKLRNAHLHRCTTGALCMACSITDMSWAPGAGH